MMNHFASYDYGYKIGSNGIRKTLMPIQKAVNKMITASVCPNISIVPSLGLAHQTTSSIFVSSTLGNVTGVKITL